MSQIDECINYSELSVFVATVLGAVGGFFALILIETRKSRCTDMNFCWGCLTVHRKLMTLDELKLDNKTYDASKLFDENKTAIPSQQFMRQPIQSSGVLNVVGRMLSLQDAKPSTCKQCSNPDNNNNNVLDSSSNRIL